MLRVASYNIRKCVGLDWHRDPERILSVLAEMDADIVLLQEVDRRLGDRVGTLPTEQLKQELGYNICQLAINQVSQGWHGNTILYRDPLNALDSARVEIPVFEPRGAVSAYLSDSKQALRVVGTHLSLVGAARKKQINSLVQYISHAQPQLPTLLAGDFNEWLTNGAVQQALPDNFKLLTPGKSFHSALHLFPLDRFVIYGDINILDYRVFNSELAKQASDHLPIIVELEL